MPSVPDAAALYKTANRMRHTKMKNFVRVPSLLRRGLPIVAATLISRPLGYVRVVIQAWLFGASAAMDAFFLAFNVPSFLQVVLLSGPLSGVMVPMLSAKREDRQDLSQLFSSIFTACLLAGLLIGGLAALAAPLIMRLTGPGLDADIRLLAVLLFRLMLPMMILQTLLSVCKGALNTVDSYGPPEYAGVVFNIVMITVALLLTPSVGIVSLAIGASMGAMAQVVMQLPFLHRHGIRYRPALQFGGEWRQILSLAQGAFILTVVTSLSLVIDRALASLLFAGAVAALNYAFLLFMLPASLCVIPLSTVLLTDLASLYHEGNVTAVRDQAHRALRMLLLLTIPAALIGALLAEPVTRLVYERGHFDAADTMRTAQALRIYLLGLPFYGGMHLITRCFYAIRDTMTPALVGLAVLGIHVAGDVIFMNLFSHWGIALARVVALIVSSVALYVLFQRRCAQLI
jgi:putative peptidoglycan lipid II flippase